jgi:DEAD/DEAH box helicase domain-containing protein
MTYTQIKVLEESAAGPLVAQNGGRDAWASGWGEVSVVEKVVGYKKIKFYTHENAGYGDVRLPEMQMHTTAFWLTVPESVVADLPFGRAAAVDGLRGLGVALETTATLALMCDPRDLGAALGDADREEPADAGDGERDGHVAKSFVPQKIMGGGPKYNPTLFLYEHVPGGTGLAERIYEERVTLLVRTLRMLERCPCERGCPACVGPVGSAPIAPPPLELDASDEAPRALPAPYSRKATALDLLRRAIPVA